MLTVFADTVGNLFGTTRQFVQHRFGYVAVSLDVLLVVVSHGVVEFLVDSTGEDEGRQRVEVGQEDDRVDDLSERPAVRSFRQFL